MPTPVSVARQCLTTEAARALDEAVAVARRRDHTQTTSLHLVSAFLALPSSPLREACTRARSSAYSPRLQFKALELCFSVALDRLPSSQHLDEPPISNSLMAAIKRSQANQRRHPESFHLQQLQQQQQQQTSLTCVKVELQQLILSILDDPVVSRVFSEAGFRSWDIKMAIVRPPPPLFRYSSSRCPPLFLCNLTGGDSEPGRRSFSFPFSGFSGFLDGDENCRRIGEVLLRKNRRNPLLVGVCANDAVRNFAGIVERGKGGILPGELSGLKFICIEKEVSKFITESGTEGLLGSRFEELGRLADSSSGSGVVVSLGELKEFIGNGSANATSFVISQLTRLMELRPGNLWLMGAVASYDTYLKFVSRFPSIEKDWDLHLLPITSLKPSMGGLSSRSQSLMESFVPFGGFFSAPSDLKVPLGSTYQSTSRCHLCNEKYEQEIYSILKRGCSVSVADQYQASLPSWMRTAELRSNKGQDVAKVKDDGVLLNAKVMSLQKKWNDICRRLHHSSSVPGEDTNWVGPQVLPGIVGFPFVADKNQGTDNHSISSTNAFPSDSQRENVFASMFLEFQKISQPNQSMPIPLVSKAKNENSPSKLHVRPSEGECHKSEGLWSPPCPLSSSSIPDGHASPSSATSVTTDLGLGTLYSSSFREPKSNILQSQKENLQAFSGFFPAEVDLVNESISNTRVLSSSCAGSDLSGQFDPRDFKAIWRVLIEEVGRQNEAIYAISHTVARCRAGNERCRGASLRRDIWFSFLGPDWVAKKRIAVALAEIIFESRQNIVCVDLASPNGIAHSNTIIDCRDINGYDVSFRGKTVLDYIAGEISKKPWSVVFLENVDKADMLVQNSLSQAIKTGKFPDSHGRQIGINGTIFVTTSSVMKGNKRFSTGQELQKFSEERILGAQGWEMQFLIRSVPECTTICNNSNILITSGSAFVNKRKLIGTGDPKELCETLEMTKRAHKTSTKYLDLNMPLEETEANDSDSGNAESDSVSQNWEAWLEDFLDQVDETVVFEPFDFDALADKILKEISKSFRNTIGSEIVLEIDSKVMEQILAAAWFSDRKGAVENWVELVLGRSFLEARLRYNLSAGSVLKLIVCEGLCMEEQAPGVRLPTRIILN